MRAARTSRALLAEQARRDLKILTEQARLMHERQQQMGSRTVPVARGVVVAIDRQNPLTDAQQIKARLGRAAVLPFVEPGLSPYLSSLAPKEGTPIQANAPHDATRPADDEAHRALHAKKKPV